MNENSHREALMQDALGLHVRVCVPRQDSIREQDSESELQSLLCSGSMNRAVMNRAKSLDDQILPLVLPLIPQNDDSGPTRKPVPPKTIGNTRSHVVPHQYSIREQDSESEVQSLLCSGSMTRTKSLDDQILPLVLSFAIQINISSPTREHLSSKAAGNTRAYVHETPTAVFR
jgi:hypothetical protein